MSSVIAGGAMPVRDVSGFEISWKDARLRFLVSNGVSKFLGVTFGITATVATCVAASQPHWDMLVKEFRATISESHAREQQLESEKIKAEQEVHLAAIAVQRRQIAATEKVQLAQKRNERIRMIHETELEKLRLKAAISIKQAQLAKQETAVGETLDCSGYHCKKESENTNDGVSL